MDLAPIDRSLVGVREVPDIALKLTFQERQLLDEIFSSLALQQKMCLLEILGVDLFKHMGELIPFFPTGAGAAFRERFSGDFFFGYVSLILTKSNSEHSGGPKVTLADHTKKTEGYIGGVTPQEWVCFLTACRKALNSHSKSKSPSFQAVIKRLDLLSTLILKPKSHTFLVDETLTTLEKYFPKCTALTHSSPEKTLQDLTTLTEFLYTGFNSGVKRGFFSVQQTCMQAFHEALKAFSKKRKLADVQNVKQELGIAFALFGDTKGMTLDNLMLALDRKLSHKSYCESLR